MVHGVVGSGEVEGQKDILLGAGAVRGVPAARLREVPAVLDLLDEAADVILHRPPLPEADLLCWDQSVPLHEVAQPGEDQPLDELAEVAREGDGPVAGDAGRLTRGGGRPAPGQVGSAGRAAAERGGGGSRFGQNQN